MSGVQSCDLVVYCATLVKLKLSVLYRMFLLYYIPETIVKLFLMLKVHRLYNNDRRHLYWFIK